ncbi:recombinase A [Microvenator marinus]|uniref:Recombinase A n=1 Tax=Microvenator marinus TaxID=2600177 RepID=A0A5B8XST7_9DELT|nr:recombinase A [Microvenator marinus]QED27113.1 recombinase A [Microvenator marinus]
MTCTEHVFMFLSMKSALAKSLLNSPFITTGRELEARQSQSRGSFDLAAVKGKLVEVRSVGSPAGLSTALSLLKEAQTAYEPIAWIMTNDSLFYPPDMAEQGIDLGALVIVRVHGAKLGARAAEHVLRSGAFGLIILDLGEDLNVPEPMQNRLMQGAHKHQSAVVCLTRSEESEEHRSLGSMVALSVEVTKESRGRELVCSVHAQRNKGGGNWRVERRCYGPVGMR